MSVRNQTQLLETVPMLPEIIERLVRRFDPLQIILFGSWARGDTHRWSDVDLLLVLEHVAREDKRELMAEALSALNGLLIATDVIVTDPAEIERRGNLVGDVLRPALREGKVIYERP